MASVGPVVSEDMFKNYDGQTKERQTRNAWLYYKLNYLGQVTKTPGTNFHSRDPGRLHRNFGFNRPIGFSGEDV